MNKIPGKPDQLHQISQNLPSFINEKPLSGEKKSFDKILSEQFNAPLESKDSLSISRGLPELEGVYKAATINQPDKAEKLTQKISSSIDLLETYATWLSDPDKTLKQASMLLEELAQQTRQLNQEVNQQPIQQPNQKPGQPPTTNQSLQQIITQLTATVEVEQIKINRGDYTDLS